MSSSGLFGPSFACLKARVCAALLKMANTETKILDFHFFCINSANTAEAILGKLTYSVPAGVPPPVPLSKLSLFSYSYRQYLKQESLDKKRKEFDTNGWSLLSKKSQVGLGSPRFGLSVSLLFFFLASGHLFWLVFPLGTFPR